MNRHVFYILSCFAGFAWLASGCAGAPALPSTTPVPPTATAVLTATPTLTPTPTPSPTPHFADPQLISDIDALIVDQETVSEFFGPYMEQEMIERIQEDPSGVATSFCPRLSDEDQSETALAVYVMALGYARDPSVVDPLLKLARESDSELVKQYCLIALKQIGGEQVGEGLLILLEETTDKEQRYSMLNVLAGMQYEPALPLMVEVLEVDSNMEYWKPIFIFGKLGDLGVPYLLDRVGDENINVRANTIYLLGDVLILPEAAQPIRERYWVEEDPGIRGLILSSLEAINPDPETVQSFSEEVIAKEKDESLVKYAQETIDLLPEWRKDIDSFISEKKVSFVDFQAEYEKLYENYGSGDKEVLARASTLADEAQLKKLRERIMLRDSDEALYDYEEVNTIIKMNRRAQAVADMEGKPWEAWPTATPVPTATPTPVPTPLPPPSQSVSGHWITKLVISPDGSRIAVGILDGIAILDAATLSQIHYLESSDLIYLIWDFTFSEDGKQLVISHGQESGVTSLSIWDIDKSQVNLLVSGTKYLGSDVLGYRPDGHIIAWGTSGGEGASLRLIDAKSGKHLENQPDLTTLMISSIAFSPDNRLLGICCNQSSSDQSNIVLWDLEENRLAGEIKGVGFDVTLHFTPDGSSLLGFDASNKQIYNWDLKTLKPSRPPVELTDYPVNYYPWYSQFSPDGRYLAVCFFNMKDYLYLFRVFVAQTGESLGSMACEHSCELLAFSPDGKKLFAVPALKELLVWELSSIAK